MTSDSQLPNFGLQDVHQNQPPPFACFQAKIRQIDELQCLIVISWNQFTIAAMLTGKVNFTEILTKDHESKIPTVWKNEKFTLTQNFFRQINYLVILLVKSLFSRNFCQKSKGIHFCYFHTVHCTLGDSAQLFVKLKYFVKSSFSVSSSWNVGFTKFFSKS